jgi:PEP-CTERM motif
LNARSTAVLATGITLAASLFADPAGAVPILCLSTQRNHMYVDSAYVSSCVDAGVGNVNGNTHTDDFLQANPGLDYVGIGAGQFSQNGNSGTFSIDPALWGAWSEVAIGFKFGTGNKPDEWFVYLLNPFVSSGDWDFVNVFNRGGGLSHVQLYGVESATQVPEPGTLALLSAGILGFAFVRRFRRS